MYDIELGADTPEVEKFSAWLAEQGHTVKRCEGTRIYVDGASATRANPDKKLVMDQLWVAYLATQTP